MNTDSGQSAAKPLNILIYEEGSTTIPQGSTEFLNNLGKGRNYLQLNKYLSGIYIIFNKITKDFYIGSSINIRSRIQFHFGKLKWNKHSNQKLQASYNKYGGENFDFDIIEFVDENLLDKEQLYLDYIFKYYNNAIFNLDNKTSGSSDFKFTKEQLLKVSKNKKGIPKSEEFKRKMRKIVLQYTREGKFVQEFPGVREAAKAVNGNHKGITSSCNEIYLYHKGFAWRFKENNEIKQFIEIRPYKNKYKNKYKFK